MSLIHVPISYGELIDKITILEIKSERIADETKLTNVRHELELLGEAWKDAAAPQTDIGDERARLTAVNEALWNIEDRIRLEEKALKPGSESEACPRFRPFDQDVTRVLESIVHACAARDTHAVGPTH